MNAIPVVLHDEMIEIDSRVVAEGLGVEPSEVEPLRRTGEITSLCERGTGEDAGLVRVTFYLGKRRVRLVLDGDGTVRPQVSAADHPNA